MKRTKLIVIRKRRGGGGRDPLVRQSTREAAEGDRQLCEDHIWGAFINWLKGFPTKPMLAYSHAPSAESTQHEELEMKQTTPLKHVEITVVKAAARAASHADGNIADVSTL